MSNEKSSIKVLATAEVFLLPTCVNQKENKKKED